MDRKNEKMAVVPVKKTNAVNGNPHDYIYGDAGTI